MKKILTIFLLFICVSQYTKAQLSGYETVIYSYDAMGNRTLRDIPSVLMSEAYSETKEFIEEEIPETEITIRVYPNPTKGHMWVVIFGMEENSSGKITVYHNTRGLIQTYKIKEEKTQIDLSVQPSDYYIMHVEVDGELSPWKIIKE